MTYSKQSNEFYLSVYGSDVSIAIHFGMKRKRSGLYTTNNFSIANSFFTFADKQTQSVLRAWKPANNRVNKIVAVAEPPAGKQYMPHQIKGIEYLLKNKRSILADQQRVGKTPQAFGFVNSLLQGLNYTKTLIIVPDNLRQQWLNESKVWACQQAQVVSAKNRIQPNYSGIYIINYANVWRHIDDILAWKPDILIDDEAHMLTNPNTKRTVNTKKIVEIVKRCVFLTGTPFSRTQQESFWLFNMIAPDHFFSYAYHEKNLEKHIDKFLLRRTRKQVFGKEPRKHRKFILLDNKSFLKEVKEEFAACYTESGDDRISFKDFSRARRELAIKKVPVLVPLITEQVMANKIEGRKTIIVAYHQEMIKGIANALIKKGITAETYYGDMTQAQKDAAFDRCQNGKSDALVVSIRSAATGLTATAFDDVIFAEMDYSPVNIEQMEDRVVLWNKKHMFYTYYLIEGSFDQHMVNTVFDKIEDQNKLFKQTSLV